MYKQGDKIIYNKCSSHGVGPIPLNSEGTIIKYIENPDTCKVVVDFDEYGIAIIPISTLKMIKD